MILNMVGGGGAGLNFTVVGGTSQPSSPSANTIWVNTSTSITSWIFSATQPTGSAGMVWFKVGTSSTAQFNALKKNNLQVYPLYVKQYVSGAWVDKTAKTYQGGKWVELIVDTFLYNKGDFCEKVTGGWTSKSIADGSNVAGTLGITKNTSSVTLWAQYISNKNSTAGYVVVNEIDVTPFKQLTINVTGVDGSYGCSFFLCLFTPGMTNWSSGTIASKQFKATGKTTLDISSVSGKVGIGIKVTNDYSNQLIKMTYDSVCLNA